MLLLKNLAYTIVVPSTFAIYLPWLLVSKQSASTGILLFISCIFFLLGSTGYVWCTWSFATSGLGTPAPFDAPIHLVIRGFYRYIRNPMYGSLLLILFGWITLFPCLALLLYCLSVGVSFHLFVILYEEPHLKKIFGSSYEEYLNQVGRWLPMFNRG